MTKKEVITVNSCPSLYKIVNLINGHFYIGSSWNGWTRVMGHMKKLRKGKHENPYLQNAMNKYGLENFEFLIFKKYRHDDLDRNTLFRLEQQYIDNLKPQYNIVKKTNYSEESVLFPSSGDKLAKKFYVKYKNEEEKLITNLRKFIRENSLNRASVSKVINGEYSNTAGWKIRREADSNFLYKETKKHEWVVTRPDGKEECVVGLSDFCKQNGILKKSMLDVANGISSHHKKWKCRRAGESEPRYKRRLGKSYKVFCPDGKEEIIQSLSKYCQENKLNYRAMCAVSNNKQESHEGYRCERIK